MLQRETVEPSSLCTLPAGFAAHPAGAREYKLALVTLPKDEDYAERSNAAFERLMYSAQHFLLNIEDRSGGVTSVQAMIKNSDGTMTDAAKTLAAEGYVIVEKRREKRFASLVSSFL